MPTKRTRKGSSKKSAIKSSAAVVHSTPSAPAAVPSKKGVILVRAAIIIFVVFFGIKLIGKWQSGSGNNLSGSAAVNNPATFPNTDTGVHPRMTNIINIGGIKTIWGYSGWASDGGANPNVNKAIHGEDLIINGHTYKEGIGTHAPSEIVFALNGRVKHFSCLVGADQAGGPGDSIYFRVMGDGKKLFQSPIMTVGMDAIPVELDVKGVKELSLKVDYGTLDSWGHGDWVNIKFAKGGIAAVAASAVESPASAVITGDSNMAATQTPPATTP